MSCSNDRLLHFIVDSTSALSIIERKSFRDLFDGLGVQVKSRLSIMKLLDENYEQMIVNIKNTMSTSEYFCTTADLWSSRQRSFHVYTCHWIDEDFRRKSAALACRRFTGSHTSTRISELIDEINTSFSLNSLNIVATVTDNGCY